MDDFLIRAVLAGFGVAFAAGPLGAFVVWRRMAYFGDATAHAAVLGVALALAFDASVMLGTFVIALGMGLAVSRLVSRGHSADATLGVLAHSALALGLVAVALVGGARINLEGFLFGDILAVSWRDLVVIWGGAALVLGVLIWQWQGLLVATLNEELARSAGVDPGRMRLILTLSLAVVVAVALKIVGALLIGAMLVIPAATARMVTRSPEAMAIVAVLLGCASVIGGLALSWFADTPAGPSIVSAAAGFYLLAVLAGRRVTG